VRLAVVALAAISSGIVVAQDTLAPGPGAELTQAKCGLCHEIAHVTRVRQSRPEWEETMRVMVQRGAPMTPDEINIITDYLSTYYNRDAPPPSTSTAAATPSDPMTKLLSQHACLGCHALDRQVVGPAFRDVANKYRGDAGASVQLARKVREGGQGVWGQVPMPPNPTLADADVRLIVDWVLGQK
jgi:cytochrome c